VISVTKTAPITVLRAVQMLDFNSVTPDSMQAFQGKPQARLLVFFIEADNAKFGSKTNNPERVRTRLQIQDKFMPLYPSVLGTPQT
jgi:hypothetical protein